MATPQFFSFSGDQMIRFGLSLASVPLAPGAQDRLSVMYQFLFLTADQVRDLKFAMTNGRKIDQYRYTTGPDTALDTPMGRLAVIHLVKQRAPETTMLEKPVPPGTFHSTLGAASHLAAILSGVLPSPAGPRYCGQSVAWTVVRTASERTVVSFIARGHRQTGTECQSGAVHS